MAFSYYKQLTYNSGFSGTSHANFPARLILSSDADLSAHVTSASGFDVAVFTDSTLSTQLAHELVNYSAGSLVIDFNIPSFTTASAPVLAYGDASITTDQSSTDTWNTNYKAVWHMDGTTDSTQNSNDLTVGGAALAAGKMNQGYDFEATESDYIDVEENGSLDLTGAFTMSTWVKFEATTGGGIYYKCNSSQWASAAVKTIDFGYYADHFYGVIAKDVNNYMNGDKALTPTAGVWYHFATSWDGTTVSNAAVKVYINGAVSTDAGAITGTPDSIQTNNDQARLGGKAKSGGDFLLDGMLEEFRISNTNRSADWILTEYNMQNANATFWTLGAEQTVGGSGRTAVSSRTAAGARTGAGSRSSASSRTAV